MIRYPSGADQRAPSTSRIRAEKEGKKKREESEEIGAFGVKVS